MANIKELLIDMADPEEQDEMLSQYAEEIALRSVKNAVKEVKPVKGDRGERGEKGEKGDRGEVGVKGDKGERGALGFQGPKGDKGDKGDRGDQGEKGKKGDSIEMKDIIEEVKPYIFRLAPRGGGNMNRNIAVGGNQSVLSKYTDINLKAGAGTTLTYSNNDTTRFTDITITASGGVTGIVRSVNAISTSQTAGAVATTDYVFVCSAGIAVTLPTAVGNSNLYTVKNTSSSSVLVATTGGQTIDGATNAILSVQYTSIDLISDGSNWDIT